MKESRRSRGAGSLFFSLIPAAFAGAFLLWLSCAAGIIDLTQELKQERRAAERVGVLVKPKTPIIVSVNDDTCIKATKTFLDGHILTIYAENTCHHTIPEEGYLLGPRYEWREIAPDRTTLKSGDDFIQEVFRPGERREVTIHIPFDDRAVEVNVQLADR